jgi:hypothetical protein
MDAREADFHCRVVPKAPDSQRLRVFLDGLFPNEVHLTTK